MRPQRRAVFLDRDGVLTEPLVREGRAYAPLEEFRLVEGVGREVARLRVAGFVCIVVTNQPEIARGAVAPRVLEEMNEQLRAATAVDDIYVCPHDPAEGCGCHKPKPGMLHAAAGKHSLDLSRSFLIGDRWRDIEAGRAAGCYTILLDRPYKCVPVGRGTCGYPRRGRRSDLRMRRGQVRHGVRAPVSR